MKSPLKTPLCKKHCRCSKALKKALRENRELKLQYGELARKYYGRKNKKNESTIENEKTSKKKGAPFGHPGWYRKKPGHFDKVETIIPDRCHHCGSNRLEPTALNDDEHIQRGHRFAQKNHHEIYKTCYAMPGVPLTCSRGQGS